MLRDDEVPAGCQPPPIVVVLFPATPPHPPPFLLRPPVILGIYSWPPSMYNLNYLSGEMRSLHDSETGFYLYHLIPLK